MTDRQLAQAALKWCLAERRRLEAQEDRRIAKQALRLCQREQERLVLRDAARQLARRAGTLDMLLKGGWDEARHPRASDGRFGDVAGEHGGGDQGGGKPSGKPASGSKARPKSVSLLGRLRSPMRRRRIISALRSESDMAEATSAYNVPDSGAFDCLYLQDADGKAVTGRENIRRFLEARAHASRIVSRQGSTPEAKRAAERVLSLAAHAFELKTLLVSPKSEVRMGKKARERKWRYAERYGLTPHLVAVDKRRGSKHSGHTVHVSVGELSPSHRLADMDKVDGYASLIGHVCPGCGKGAK
jgi:hypothetical protein